MRSFHFYRTVNAGREKPATFPFAARLPFGRTTLLIISARRDVLPVNELRESLNGNLAKLWQIF